MSAYDDLMELLKRDEKVEAIVFGGWGWSNGKKPGYNEPDPPPVPMSLRKKIMSLKAAQPMMQSWSFYSGYGSPQCYAVNIWTNKRVIWVTQYDGSTSLSSAPRNPCETLPDMPGG
jgi:hypothetical protein